MNILILIGYIMYIIKVILFFIFVSICIIELWNYRNYQKYRYFIDQNKNSFKIDAKIDPKIDIDDQTLESYSNFMINNIVSDNFLNIFKASYPDGIMTIPRIKTVLSYYIYNISYIEQIPQNDIIVHKTINYLTNRLSKSYILGKYIKNENSPIEWLNIDQMITYKNIYEIFIDYINNIIGRDNLIKAEYKCIDVSQNIRFYYKNNNNKFVNIILCGINGINNVKSNINKLNNYIEITPISPYQMNQMNNKFHTIDEIAEEFKYLFQYIDADKKINIYCADVMTIFIPYLAKYYGDKINSIQMIDPIAYPYAYHTFYNTILHSDKDYIKKIRKNINFMMMLQNNPMIYTYLNSLDYTDLKNNHLINKIYSHKIHITFSPNHNLFTDRDILTTQLSIKSNVDIK